MFGSKTLSDYRRVLLKTFYNNISPAKKCLACERSVTLVENVLDR